MKTNAAPNHANGSLENRLLEVFDTLWDDFVDPRDAYFDPDGEVQRC